MAVICSNELRALKFNLQRLMSENGETNSEELKSGNKQRRFAELPIKRWHRGPAQKKRVSPIKNTFFLPLAIEQTGRGMSNLHNKVYIRATPSNPPPPPPRTLLKFIYARADCPGCSDCQDDLEELEKDAQQM